MNEEKRKLIQEYIHAQQRFLDLSIDTYHLTDDAQRHHDWAKSSWKSDIKYYREKIREFNSWYDSDPMEDEQFQNQVWSRIIDQLSRLESGEIDIPQMKLQLLERIYQDWKQEKGYDE